MDRATLQTKGWGGVISLTSEQVSQMGHAIERRRACYLGHEFCRLQFERTTGCTWADRAKVTKNRDIRKVVPDYVGFFAPFVTFRDIYEEVFHDCSERPTWENFCKSLRDLVALSNGRLTIITQEFLDSRTGYWYGDFSHARPGDIRLCAGRDVVSTMNCLSEELEREKNGPPNAT